MTTLLTHPALRILAAMAALIIAATICYLSLIPATEAPAPQFSDKIKHFVAYAALAAPLGVAFGIGKARVLAGFAIAATYGMTMEIAQMMGDAGREGSWLDIAANLAGAIIGLAIVTLLRGDWCLFGGDRR